MHVALVTAAFPEPRAGRYPGIERLARELTDQLLADGMQVTVVTTFWNGGTAEGRHGDARILRTRDISQRVGRLGSLADAHYWSWGRSVGRLLAGASVPRPDVVHALSPVASVPALVRSGFPVVTTFHHHEGLRGPADLLYKPFHRILEARAYHGSTLMVAPSRASGQVLDQAYGVPSDRIRVVPWGVDLTRFRPGNPPPSDDLRILFVGPHEPRKGLVFLLEALALLRQEGVRVRLTTVGRGSQLPELQHRARNLGVSDAVTFSGYLEDPGDIALRRLYDASDVFVLPSLQEGFGFVLVEAMASGLPVIASNVSAMPEVVGDAGVLVPPQDARSLANALGVLAGDPAKRYDLGRRGRLRAESMFGWGRVTAQLRSVYEEAVRMTS